MEARISGNRISILGVQAGLKREEEVVYVHVQADDLLELDWADIPNQFKLGEKKVIIRITNGDGRHKFFQSPQRLKSFGLLLVTNEQNKELRLQKLTELYRERNAMLEVHNQQRKMLDDGKALSLQFYFHKGRQQYYHEIRKECYQVFYMVENPEGTDLIRSSPRNTIFFVEVEKVRLNRAPSKEKPRGIKFVAVSIAKLVPHPDVEIACIEAEIEADKD